MIKKTFKWYELIGGYCSKCGGKVVFEQKLGWVCFWIGHYWSRTFLQYTGRGHFVYNYFMLKSEKLDVNKEIWEDGRL